MCKTLNEKENVLNSDKFQCSCSLLCTDKYGLNSEYNVIS